MYLRIFFAPLLWLGLTVYVERLTASADARSLFWINLRALLFFLRTLHCANSVSPWRVSSGQERLRGDVEAWVS